jgi:methylmalonyl-CoA mutase C-terminal domain/subunit
MRYGGRAPRIPAAAFPSPTGWRRVSDRESRPAAPEFLPAAAVLDHVGIAVASLAEALSVYPAMLGLEPVHVEDVPAEGVRVALLPLAGGGAIELLEPLEAGSTVGRFLAKRGPGVHHLSFRVPDCGAAIRAAEAAGVRTLPPAPRPGSRGSLVAFFDPRDTGGVLIEVCQRSL